METVGLRIRKTISHIWITILNKGYQRRPYHEYYTAAMRVRSWVDPQFAIGGRWDEIGQLQFDYMKSVGLLPGHRLLDFGCGALRGGLFFIDYLDAGNYEGVDISPEALANGRRFIKALDLAEKSPTLHLSTAMSFEEFEGRAFDYILAQSVLTHMPREDIAKLFRNIPRVMKPGTRFYATFFDGGRREYTTQTRLNFYYPYELLAALAGENGLSTALDPLYAHPRGQSMIVLRLAADV